MPFSKAPHVPYPETRKNSHFFQRTQYVLPFPASIQPPQVGKNCLLHLDPSTVTGILGRLERSKVIVRETDPADGRRARLFLSATGRDLYRRQAGTVEAAVRRALASLAPSEVTSAAHVLGALASQLAAETGKPTASRRGLREVRDDRRG